MTRGEAWLFSAGLLAVALVSREVPQRKFALALGWGVPIIAYMKYLADYTGNPIYPIYWNFLANAGGQWESRQGLMAYQLAARPVLAAVCLAAAAGCAWTLWKRPRAQLMYLLGFGTTSFIAGFIGLTAYLKSYEPWFWMTRFFAFPYLFAGLLLAVFFLSWLPGRVPAWGRAGLGWAAVAVTLCLMQFAWPAVLHDVNPGYTRQTSVQALRDEGLFVAKAYEGGTVLIPEVTPQFTYALGRYSGIPTSHLLGEMYGPIYYYQGPDPYAAWATVGPKMWDWLQKADITLLVMSPGDRRFTTMQQEHPERFADLGTVPHSDLELFRVNPW